MLDGSGKQQVANYLGQLGYFLGECVEFLESRPDVCLWNARRAGEAICRVVLAGDRNLKLPEPSLASMLKALQEKKLLPQPVQLALETVQKFGNFASHVQPDRRAINASLVRQCLPSVVAAARWLYAEHLQLPMPPPVQLALETLRRGRSSTGPATLSGYGTREHLRWGSGWTFAATLGGVALVSVGVGFGAAYWMLTGPEAPPADVSQASLGGGAAPRDGASMRSRVSSDGAAPEAIPPSVGRGDGSPREDDASSDATANDDAQSRSTEDLPLCPVDGGLAHCIERRALRTVEKPGCPNDGPEAGRKCHLNWSQAQALCSERHARLPTVVEWARAYTAGRHSVGTSPFNLGTGDREWVLPAPGQPECPSGRQLVESFGRACDGGESCTACQRVGSWLPYARCVHE